jgi:hypothetical protein
MNINGFDIPVDVEAELQEFEWEHARWTHEKLIACSPFREDNSPSFYCWLIDTPKAPAGSWGDSGGNGSYEKGGFLSLLSFLRNETPEETAAYLESKYGVSSEGGLLHLKTIRLESDQLTKKPLSFDLIAGLEPHPYLRGRGIPIEIQKALKVGFDATKNAIAIPWFNPDGTLGNIKYRRVDSKFFWYTKGGKPTGKMMYGIHIFHRKDYLNTAVITEAEIDAMYAISAGLPALAVGGSKFSKDKRDLILETGIKKLIIASDNDAAGVKLRNQIIDAFGSSLSLYVASFPGRYKDLNDIKDREELKHYLNNAERVQTLHIKLR